MTLFFRKHRSDCLTSSGILHVDGLGDVVFTVKSTARRFIARRSDDNTFQLTVPPGSTLDETLSAIRQMTPRLLAVKPRNSSFHFGQTFDFDSFSIRIVAVNGYGQKCTVHQVSPGIFEIRADSLRDLSSPDISDRIKRLAAKVAHFVAPEILLPRAEKISSALGVRPAKWQIAHGHKTLGRCSSDRTISLSCMLVFYPAELRDFVICHELAHLTEMNHSDRFHRLCDRYCGGRESELRSLLRKTSKGLPF